MKLLALIICFVGLIDQYSVAENNIGQPPPPPPQMNLTPKSGLSKFRRLNGTEWECTSMKGSYSKFFDAMKDCSSDSSCQGIYDNVCKSKQSKYNLDLQLCTTLANSGGSGASCIYQKIQESTSDLGSGNNRMKTQFDRTSPYSGPSPRSGQILNNEYLWSPNTESLLKYTLPNLVKDMRKTFLPNSSIERHPLKLDADVRVQAFDDQTLRVKFDHIQFSSNGNQISLQKAHQILDGERSNQVGNGHTAQRFLNSLITPFLIHTKRHSVKKVVVSKHEPSEVTEIKKVLASDLGKNGRQVNLQLVMKKAIVTPMETPRFPMKVDLVDGNSGIAMKKGHTSGSGDGEEIVNESQRLKGFCNCDVFGGNCPEGLKQCIADCETEFADEPDYDDRISGCLSFCEANCE